MSARVLALLLLVFPCPLYHYLFSGMVSHHGLCLLGLQHCRGRFKSSPPKACLLSGSNTILQILLIPVMKMIPKPCTTIRLSLPPEPACRALTVPSAQGRLWFGGQGGLGAELLAACSARTSPCPFMLGPRGIFYLLSFPFAKGNCFIC